MHVLFAFTCAWLVSLCASVAPEHLSVPLDLRTQNNPWQSNCNHSLHDYPGCIVSDRKSLPTVREDIDWEIHYIRVLFPRRIQMLQNARGYHGAVLVSAIGSDEVFLMGYFVYEFGMNIAIPIPTEHGFKWENPAAVSWFPSWIRTPFDYFDSVWPLGQVSGSIVNKWLDDVPRWAKQHDGYRLVSLWSGPALPQAQVYVEDSTCQTFCEYSFKKLHTLGAKFTSQYPLCRNYAPFITQAPKIANISNNWEHAEAINWYANITLCFTNWYFTGNVCEDALAKQKFAFATGLAGQTPTDDAINYYQGILQQPYFAGFANDRYIEQRMLLPWQNYEKDARVGECVFPESQTSLTRDMNKLIARGLRGVYTGGPGVLVRNPFDGLTDKYKVAPATLWVNDLFAPSQLYPTSGGSPWCPHSGTDGFMKLDPCTSGPWDYAQLALLAGYSVQKFFPHFDRIQNADWNYGVFYPYDANTVDKRCRWLGKYQAYDCPGGWLPLNGTFAPIPAKIGAGGYPSGSPVADPKGPSGGSGGGAGCHFEATHSAIDQTDATTVFHENLVMNQHCQCNTAFDKDWNEWVDNWILHATPKPGFEYQGWFKHGNKAPSWGVDVAACWMDNPRDMIQLQNALWWRRSEWSNQMLPTSNWQGARDPGSNRPYWGWNEVPVDRVMMNDPGNWDAVVIKLPAALCGKVGSNDDSIACLNHQAQLQLEKDLGTWVSAGYLLLGAEKYSTKPGSSVVLVRETMDFNGNYQKEFFCQPWTSPSNRYDIAFISDKGPAPEGTGACYAQSHSGAVAYV